jgi:uridine kinase
VGIPIFIVGLAGPSGSGKSTVARRVASRLGGHVFSIENYSFTMEELPLEERARVNYDEPSAIDVKLLQSHILNYAAGKTIQTPGYDFAQHASANHERELVPASSLLIVEGILALHFAELRPHFNLAVYLEVPEEVRFHRRKVRDITERQRSIDFIEWQYKTHVLPATRQYVVPSKAYADLVLDNKGDLATIEQSLSDAIAKHRDLAAGRSSSEKGMRSGNAQ